ncbi:hypothetical protein [Sphaerisporangium siamense]|uniref:Peptidase M43 pregnancy-associated plasma-A domain-containing protein n=1 Tax=Sphaerisporangium siamense TaxID=795645 RepID=A0A7W7G7Q5_9ACTN|nr:hypothetical protein [Sphaerisporangium siamense]MBB4698755.1 hypothetical protein [Sphaerisporangium siamense]
MLVALAVGLVLAPPSSAGITHFDQSAQDGGNVSYCYTSSVPAYLKDNISGGMDYMDTRLSGIPAVTYHSSCDVAVSDGTPRTDIAWFEGWRDGVYGETFCKYAWPNDGSSNEGECDQDHIWLVAEAVRRDAPNDEHGYSSLVCHEGGHALGFIGDYDADHPPGGIDQQDCMGGRSMFEPSPADTVYSNHHVSDFNAYYN